MRLATSGTLLPRHSIAGSTSIERQSKVIALSEVCWRRQSSVRSKALPQTLRGSNETFNESSSGGAPQSIDHIMAATQEVRNKVVVRKLPPGISQEEVQAAIDVVCQGKYDWFTFVPGKVRCAPALVVRFCRFCVLSHDRVS